MKYPVLSKFRDKYTKEIYAVGKIIELTDEKRIADLQKRKLIGDEIKPAINTTEPEHVGGGYYRLPDGTRVKGKKAAIEAMLASSKEV